MTPGSGCFAVTRVGGRSIQFFVWKKTNFYLIFLLGHRRPILGICSLTRSLHDTRLGKSGFYGFCRTKNNSDFPPNLSCFPPHCYQTLPKFTKAYQSLPKFTKFLPKLTKFQNNFTKFVTRFFPPNLYKN